jgi:[ribosomal protein S5]-alanine N-acetyltransferase
MADNDVLIETPRLWLRTMRAEDLEALLAIFSDPKVMAAFDSPPFTRSHMQGWLQRNLDHQARYGYGLFSVICRQSNILIGDCGLEVMQVDGEPAAELGYDFRSDYWNQGYASEAASAVRDFVFQRLQMPRLISLIRVGNQASRRVAEKVGMRYLADHQSGDRVYWKFQIEAPSA